MITIGYRFLFKLIARIKIPLTAVAPSVMKPAGENPVTPASALAYQGFHKNVARAKTSYIFMELHPGSS
ncbi:MAG: hypothetical protein H7Z13_00115 [Ferruginibacter sp.]|nr:hypothetical protein [Ferruginibacter sp.]